MTSKGKGGKKKLASTSEVELELDPRRLLEKAKKEKDGKERTFSICASFEDLSIFETESCSLCLANACAKLGLAKTLKAARLAVDIGHILTFQGRGGVEPLLKGAKFELEILETAKALSRFPNDLTEVVEHMRPVALIPPVVLCPFCGCKLSAPSWHTVTMYSMHFVGQVERLILYCRNRCKMRFSPWCCDTMTGTSEVRQNV